MTLQVLVVDDEPIARSGLAAMARAHLGRAAVHQCGDRDSAILAIRSTRPDVVLLDVELNPGTGFDVIAAVGAAAMPPVIFVTAFDRFAVQAFEAAALDYVMKPVDPRRLAAALERATARASSSRTEARVAALEAALRRTADPPLSVPHGDRTVLIETREIVRIEAADYYAKIHARGRTWLLRETLDALERRLPRPPFFRVHRSEIVNVRYVKELVRLSRYRHCVVLHDGSRIPLSAGRRGALEEWLARRADP